MKINFIKCILFLLFSNCFGQSPTIQWQKCFGGTNADEISSITKTLDGGYISLGWSKSNDGDVSGNHGGNDVWIAKLNSAGDIQWQKSYGGTGNEVGGNIIQLSDGSYIFCSRTDSNNGDVSSNHGGLDTWVVKLNSIGDIQWEKTYGGTLNEVDGKIRSTIDGGYVFSTSTYSNNGDVTGSHGSLEYWVVKLSSIGNIQWQKTLGGSNADEAYNILPTIDNGYIISGTTQSNNGNVTNFHGISDFWVVKLDILGNIIWQKTLGGSNGENLQNLEQTSDGSFIVCGGSNSNDGDVSGNHGGYDAWLVKLNSSGNIQWQKTYGGTGSDWFLSIQKTIDNGFIAGGYSNSNNGDISGNHGGVDCCLIKLNSIGDIQWQKSIGGTLDDYCYSIETTSDDGYILTGTTFSNNGDITGNHGAIGETDGLVLKLNSDLLSVSEFNENNIKIFPNPVSNNLFIDLNNEQLLSAKIFDINGKIILTSNNNVINLTKLDNGTYIIEITTINNKTIRKKILKNNKN